MSPPGSDVRVRLPDWRIPIALALLLFSSLVAATTTINHSFSPATILQGDGSTYRISIANDALVPLTDAAVTVLLPTAIVISDPLTIGENSCGFTVSAAVPGTNIVYLTGGTIPAGTGAVDGLCRFEIGVRSVTPGNHVANIPANSTPDAESAGYRALENTVPVFNETAANATLSVSPVQPPTGTKSFSPSPAIAGDPTRLTITLSNPNPSATIPLTSFTDALPNGMLIADPANASSSCSGTGAVNGSLTAAPGAASLTLTGGTIGEGGSCTLSVDVIAASVGSLTNSLAEGAIGNTRGLTSPAFERELPVVTPIGVSKTFGADVIPAGQPVLMTIRIANNSLVNPLEITSFADDLTGTTLRIRDTQSDPAAPADPTVACTGGGPVDGTLDYTPDNQDTTLTLTGANAGPSGACTITAYVTSLIDGQHTNSIPSNAVQNPGNLPSPAASASLGVNAQLTVDKSVSLNNVAPGQWTRFTVTIFNWSGGPVGNVNFTDNLPSADDSQMVLRGTNPVSSVGCEGGTFAGEDGEDTLTWTDGTIPGGSGLNPGVCTIVFDARLPEDAPNGLTFTNEIPISGICGTDDICNTGPSPAVNTVSVSSVAVGKSFSPASIPQGGQSTLTIRIRNRVAQQLNDVNLTDNLPTGVTLAANPMVTNTCGGTLEAFPNTSQLILTDGTIAPRPDFEESSDCIITARVTGSLVGNYENIITPTDFDSSVGTIPANVSATLGIATGLSGSKSFTPTAVATGGRARVKITLLNGFNGTLTNVSVTDPLGTGLTVANPANASSNCAGSPTLVVNPGATSVQLLGATLPASGSCDLFFDVVTSGSGPWLNTIPAGNITSAEGPVSTGDITATLAETDAALSINKSFDPVIITGGVPSLLRIDIINPTAIPMQGIQLTDTLPNGIEVYSVPDASTTCPGGLVTAIPGDNKVILSGASIAPNQTCQVFATVTSVSFLNLTNSLAVGAIVTDQGYTNSVGASATLSTLQGLGVTKSFSPDVIGVGQTARLRIRLISTLDPNAANPVTLTGVSYTDNLPTGMLVADPPAIATNCAGTGTGDAPLVTTSNVANNGVITVSQATIPPGSNCFIDVDIQVDDLGAYTNIIPERQVVSDQGVLNESETQATLNVVESPTLAKAFAEPFRNPGQPNRLTVTINNNDPSLTLTNVALTDTLPAGLAIANPANAATTCGNGQVIASPGEAFMRLIGATLPANSSCTFSADVVGNDAGEYINFIDVGALTSDQGLTNTGTAQATMGVGSPPGIAKAFDPVGMAPGDTATLTITLTNPNAAAVSLTEPLIDALPGNLFVANTPNPSTTCTGGSLTANAGATSISLAAGAEIPGDSSCTISVDVTTSVEGVYTNLIAAGQLQTTTGSNPSPATASLAVSEDGPLAPPTVAKTFSPGTIMAGGTSTLTLSLGNPNASSLTLSADFIDTLPTGVVIADPASVGGTCAIGSVTATAGSNSITYADGAEIPAGGCTITVAVTSNTGGSYTNSIPAGALETNGGTNLNPATAGLVVQTPTPPTVGKAFAPNTINPGGVARLTISLGNANAGAITLSADLVDTLPTGVTIADPANIGGTCTVGSITATAGSGTITYASGAEIPSGGCTIAVDVTASDSTGSPFVNTIPAGALQTDAGNNGAPATANLFINPPQPPSLSKFFSPSGIIVGGTSTLTLSFGNGNLAPTTLAADLVDTLPFGVVIADPPNIQAVNGCDAGKVVATAGGGTVTYQSGAPIPVGGCSISVNVISSVASQAGHLNSIAAGALQTTDFGASTVGTSARLKVSPLGISKAVDGSIGPLAIGDEVTYSVDITVPAGLNSLNPFVVRGLTLTDTLPDGLEYLTGTYSLTQNSSLSYAGPLPSDFTVAGDTLTAALGQITNASGAPQSFTISYRLRIENLPATVAGSQLINTATLSSNDSAATWDDNATVTVGEPALAITKAMTPAANLTAGDLVTVSLTVTNTGEVPAFEVAVTDLLNDGTDNDLFALAATGITDTSTGTGVDDFDFGYDENTGTITFTAKPGVSLAANGGTVTFSFTATVGPDIRTGWTYSNAASAIGNSQDGGTNGRETPEVDSNTATVNTGVAAVAKTIAATSEPWTTNTQVAIGEVITYRLTYTVPQGVTVSPLNAAIFADTLPMGQQFLTGTATIRASAAGVIIADGSQVTGVANDGELPTTTATPITPSVGGQNLGFAVGTVRNTGTGAAQVIIDFDALVLNTSNNNHNEDKTNTATLNYVNRDGNTQSQTATQQTRIVEPLPSVTKSSSPTTASGGDTVTFTVVATAATGSNRTRLWDVVVTDTLPARYLNPTLTSAVLSRGNVNVTTCGSFAGQTLTLSMDCLDAAERYLAPGQTITLTYTATLDPSIAFEEVVTNTAQVRGTSLPGSYGTGNATPGAPDSDTGERTGSNQPNTSGQAVNDLNATASATLTANRPSLTKEVADASLPIGAITTATITVSVPVGQTGNFVITDTLPAGLRYTGAPISITLGSGVSASNSPPIEPGAGTDPLVFDFGTVQNSAATSQSIVITYPVQVENVLGNQRNTQLTNTAVLTYSGASAPFPADSATITVREPALALSKTITAGTPAVAGSEVSYQLTVSNTDSFATAYRMNLTDVLPADLLGANGGDGPFFTDIAVINPDDAVLKSAGGVLIAGDAVQSTANTLAWPLFDLPPNTTLTISYTATVVADAVTGTTLTNEVAAKYNSLAAGTDGRDGSDVLDDTDPNALNNYGQTTSRDLTLDANIALQKTLTTDQPDANFAIGEEVLFDVKVSLLAGVTNNVVVTDTLPAGLAFVEMVGNPIAEPGISYTGAGTAMENPTGTVTVDLGDVTIDPGVVDKSLNLQFKTQVRNIASNQNGVDLTNSATATSDIGDATDTLDVTVVEPVLQVTKTPDTTVPALGNLVTYTVVVSHATGSTADAYQVELTDLIQTGLTYQAGSTTGQASVDETNPAAPVFTLGSIANGETKTFSYQAEVDLDAVVGSALQNQISGSFASTADANGAADSGRNGINGVVGLNDYVFGTTADVTPATTAFLYPVKTVALVEDVDSNGQVDPGDTLEYTIVLTNQGADATGVVFTDPIPANTTYVASSLTSDVGTVDDSGAPNLQVNVGNLAAGATAIITFRVTVDGGTAVGTVISNQGLVDSDQTVPTPTDADGVRDNGFQPTEVPVGGQPPLQSPLYAEKRVLLINDVAGNGVVNPGDTLRYSLVLSNLGDQPLTNVALTDVIPAGLTYVADSVNSSAGTATVSGQSLTWAVPTLAAGDFEILDFRVTVDDPLPGSATDFTFTNQGATTSNETPPGLTDGNGNPSDGFQPTEIDATTGAGAPRLDVQKRWSLAQDLNGNGLANPGDVIGYQISVTNEGSAATIDARLTDAIPANTTLVAGSVTTDRGVVTGTDPIAINLGSLLPGEVATVRFQVTINASVADGTIIENQATLTGNNFDDIDSDDNGNPADGRNPTQTPVVTDDPGVATPGGLTKTLVATSESASTGAEVLIGEVVTYQVSVQVPPGTLREALIEDVLPAGLGYIPGTARLSRTFTTGLNAAQNPGDINAAASGVFVTLFDGSELQQSGQTLRLLLGDVINSDAAAATYTLEYQAVVRNVAANRAGTDLDNQATLRWLTALNQPANLSPVTQTLTVLEPALAIAKEANPSVIVPEGTTTFTLTITHPSGGNRATAYDVQLSDLFTNWASIDPGSITTTPSDGVIDVDTSASTTSALNVSVGTFPVDGQLVITVEATDAGVRDDFVDNTANLTWTSLPGAQGTNDATPGAPGSETGERTGSGGTNNYAASATERVRVVDVNFAKALDNAQGRYAIGDEVEYRLTVTLPPDLDDLDKVVLENSVIADVLDAGLVYVPDSLVATLQDGDITVSPALPGDFTVTPNSPQTGETTLTFNAGTLTNTNIEEARTLVLTYRARVANVPANQNHHLLDNAATFDFNVRGNPSAEQLSDAAQVQVGEPNLALAKTIMTATTGLDAGSVVGFQVVVSNTGTTTAFDTVLSDTLPPRLRDITDLQVTGTSGGAPMPTLGIDGDTWSSDPFDLPVGGSVTLTFSATLTNDVQQGQTIQNQVLADYDSRSGDDPNQRAYDADALSPVITVNAEVTLDKAFHPNPAKTSYTIGEEFQYRLTLGIIEGVTRAVSIVDTLPDGVTYLNATVGLGNTGIIIGNPASQPTDVTGQVLTFNFGDISNPANGNPNDDVITIDIRVRVDNLAANQAGTVLGNNAHVDYTDGQDAAQRVDFDADAEEPGIQPLEATLVEPDLSLNKTVNPSDAALGTEVEFTLSIAHTTDSGSDAFDLVVVDSLPAGLTYVNGSASLAPTSVTGDSSTGQVLTFNLGSLTTAAGQTQVTLRALAERDLVIGQALTNSARLTWASLPGATGAPDSGRNGSDGEGGLNDYVSTGEAVVTPTTPAFLYPVKTVALVDDVDSNGQVDPGDTLEYTIVLTNQGADATGVVFTDPIPANTTYVASSLTSDVGTVDDSGAPNLQVNVGNLAAGATAIITFRVTVDGGTAVGTVISNQGLVDSDQTVPTPTDADGVRDNGFQPTEVPVGGQPPLQSPLYAEKRVLLINDVAGNGVVNPGDTLRYSLVLSNLGDQPLTNVALTDVIPAGLTYVADSVNSSAGTATVSGQSLTWAVPTLAAGDFEILDFRVTVDDPLPGSATDFTFTNQGATTSNETPPGLTDGNGNPSDGFQPTEIDATTGAGAPRLDVQKRWSLAQDLNGNGLANPGDVIGYQISVTNEGSAATIDARLTDAIPANTTLVAGSVTTDRGVVTGTDPIAINLGSLLPGEVATVRFQVTINASVADGTIIENQATLTGNNFDDIDSDDNGNPADGRNPTQTPVVTDDPGVATPGGLTKTLVATSESASTGAEVLIGEVVTYQVSVQVPPGTLREALIEDVLPAGLGYIPGTARLSRTFTTGLNAAQNPGDINAAASGVFVTLFDGSELQQSGQTLRLLLGDVINSDAAAATYTLEYQAVVRNVAANRAGTDLDNQATLRWLTALNQPANLSPVTQTLTVLEPALAIAKEANPSVIVPEGTTTFTLTITHPSGGNRATAYDVQLSDLFTNWASIDPGSITTTPSDGVIDVDTSASTTSALNVSVGTFPVDGQLVITVEATDAGVRDDFVDNTANLTWTSLPGAQGTNDATPGAPGSETGERTGSGGTNNYAASATERVRVVDVNFAKALDNAQGRYAIGDEVEYRLTVTLPPDLDDLDKVVLENSVIADVLDAGLVYVPDSLVATLQDGDITVSPALPGDFTVTPNSPQTGETTLTFNAGTLTNTNIEEARTLVLTYRARVANVPANQNHHLLDNAATFDFNVRGNPSAEQLSDAAQVQVGEPNLALAKTIMTATTGLDAGSVVGFQVVVSNTGTTTAFDTVLSDTLPPRLRDITDLQVTGTSGGAPMPTLGIDGDTWSSDPFDLPVGGSVTLTFSATLTNDVQQGQTIQNQVLADYDSRSGDDPNQRAYDADALSPVITVNAEVTLDKAFHPNPAKTSYTIGEEFQYRLTLGIIEGVTRAVSIVDELPAGVSFLDAEVGLGNTGIGTEESIGPNDQPTTVVGISATGQTLTFDLGDISNPANGNPNDDVITIDIRVRVDNLAANQAGTVLRNNAHVDYTDGQDAAQRVDFDADAEEPGIQPLEATLVEPDLNLIKTVNPSDAALGTEVEFTLSIAHTVDSGSDAFDLVVVDTLPAGLTYVVGSASPAPASVDGQVLTFNFSSLSISNGNRQVTLRALLASDLSMNEVLTNQARLTWASLPGATGAPDSGRNGSDGESGLNDYVNQDSQGVTVLVPSIALSKVGTLNDDDDIAGVSAGDTITYAFTVTNTGNATLNNITLADLVEGVTINGDSIATLAPAQVDSTTFTGTYTLTQDDIDTGSFTNTATVTGQYPGYPDVTDSDDDTQTLEQEPALALVKVLTSADPDPIVVGSELTYTVTATNGGNVTLTNVVVSDSRITPASATCASVAPTETCVLTGTYTVLQADVDAGRVLNTATADSNETAEVSDELNTPIATAPVLAIDKLLTSADPDPIVVGSELTYTVTATNGGDVTLTNVVVSDDLITPDEITCASVAVGGTCVLEGTYTVLQADVDAGRVLNTATADSNETAEVSDELNTPIATAPVLAIDKLLTSADPDPIVVGSELTYTVTATNGGDVTLTNVVVSDDLITPDEITCASVAVGGTCVLEGTYTVLQADVDAGRVLNTATAGSDQTESVEDTLTTSISAEAALTLVKSADPQTYAAVGDEITYTFEVTNSGNVTLFAPFAVADDRIAEVDCSGAPATLLPGAGFTCTASDSITAEDLIEGSVTNVASATGADGNGDQVTSPTDTATVRVEAADVGILKSASPASANPGDVVTFTLTLSNAGPADATGVSLLDTLPNGYDAPAAISTGGVYDGTAGTIRWSGLSVSSGASLTLSYTALARVPGDGVTFVNTVTVTGSDQYDPNLDNNTATATVVPLVADLAITKTQVQAPATPGQDPSTLVAVEPSAIGAGETLYYLLKVENLGPDAALDVTVSDTLPDGIRGAERSFNVGNSWGDWTGSFNVTSLAAGATTYILIRGQVDAAQTETLVNVATVASAVTADPNPENNDDTLETPVVARADLELEKVQLVAPLEIGGLIEYRLTVTNRGPAVAAGVVIEDALDALIDAAEYSTDGGLTYVSPWTGSYTLQDDLAVGASFVLRLRGTLVDDGSNPEIIGNTATVTAATEDPNPDNNSDTTETPIDVDADVRIEKTGPASVIAGEPIGYSITVTNDGPATALDVRINDSFASSVFDAVEVSGDGGTNWSPWTGQYVVGDLAVGESRTIALRAIVRGNVAVGTVLRNTAEAESVTPDRELGNNTDRADTTVGGSADVGVVKTLQSAPEAVVAGGSVEFLITYFNLGPSDATNFIVDDVVPEGLTDVEASFCELPFVEWTTPRNVGTVVAGGDCAIVIRGTLAADFDGDLTNTAVVRSDLPDPDDSNNEDSATVTVLTPALSLTKTATALNGGTPDPFVYTAVGDTITYTFAVTNTGNAPLSAVVVSDDTFGVDVGTVDTLAVDATATFTYDHLVTAADLDAGVLNNTATATGTYGGTAYEATDTATVSGEQAGALTLEKTATLVNGAAAEPGEALVFAAVDDEIRYSYTLTNTGNVTLTGLAVADDKTPVTCPESTLAAGAEITCTATYAVTQADLDAGEVTNRATASGLDPSEREVTSEEATATVEAAQGPELTLEKVLDAVPAEIASGTVLTYTVTATNSGNVTLTAVVVSDPLLTSDSQQTCASVAPGETCVLTGRYPVTQADVDAGEVENTATVDSDQTEPVEDTVITPIAGRAELTLAKLLSEAPEPIALDSVLTYTVTATNSGTVTLTTVVVSDSRITPNEQTCASVAPGETCVLTGRYTVTQDDVDAGAVLNTATADSEQTDPPVEAELTTPIAATPALSVAKVLSSASTDPVAAGSELTYTVTATNTGNVTLTEVVVSDSLIDPSTFTCARVGVGDTCVLTGTYVVSQADVDAGQVLNTATADSAQTDPVEDALTTPIAPVPALSVVKALTGANPDPIVVGSVLSYTVTATNDGTVTLAEVVVSDNRITPASATCASVAPGATCVLTGSYTVTQTDVDAGAVVNTAAAQSDQTDPVEDTLTTAIETDPALELEKVLSGADPDPVVLGRVLTYTVTATNTGDVTLTAVVVSDSLLTPNEQTCASVAPGATCVLTGTYTVTLADVIAGSVVNTASVDSDQTEPQTTELTTLVQPPVAPTAADDASLDNPIGTPVTLPVVDNDAAADGRTLDPTTVVMVDADAGSDGKTKTVEGEGTWTVDPDTGAITFTPESGFEGNPTPIQYQVSDDLGTPSNPATVTVTYLGAPALTLEKVLSGANPDPVVFGSVLTYTVTATNDGDVTLTNVVVSDDLITPDEITCASVAPGATCELVGTYT
ncbi:hypothetical protein CKO25_09955, partial [Thiocapsa imhoffii]